MSSTNDAHDTIAQFENKHNRDHVDDLDDEIFGADECGNTISNCQAE